MEPLPHIYQVSATAAGPGPTLTTAAELPSLQVDTPVSFGGEGGCWSPEELLMAAQANCFLLTFRSLARTAAFEWCLLRCRVEGRLERVDRQLRFTHITLQVQLTLRDIRHRTTAERMLERADGACIIGNSLRAERELHCEVVSQEVASSS